MESLPEAADEKIGGLRGGVVSIRFLVIFLVVLMTVVSCGPRKKSRTLASLEQRPTDVRVKQDLSVDHAREKAMRIYQEFDRTESDSVLRLEAKRRLADLELEKSDDLTHLNNRRSRRKPDVGYDNAIRLYQELLTLSRDAPNRDRILYQLAKAYENKGELKRSLEAINLLVRDYPSLPYMDEVQFRRGELAFLLADYKQAADAYGKVLAMGEFTAYYDKALYKHGWSLLKAERYQQALAPFVNLLDRRLADQKPSDYERLLNSLGGTSGRGSGLTRGDAELLKDVFRAVNLSLGYLDGAKSIKTYFDRRGRRPFEYILYDSLGRFYLSQERIRDAAEVYRSYSVNYPQQPNAPFAWLKMMDAYKRGGFARPLFKAKQEFVARYGLSNSFWKTAKEPMRGRLLAHLKSNMQELGSHYHATAQKSRRASDYDRAISSYRDYMKTFPKDPQNPEINFLVAEALFERGKFEDAVREYEKTAYSYRKSERSAEAAYAALLAYTRHEKSLRGKERDSWRRLSVGSALRFGKMFPADSRAPEVVIKVAEELFSRKKRQQAAQAARQVLEMKAEVSPDIRLSAWTIIAHTAFDSEDFIEAEQSYKIAIGMTRPGTAQYKEINEGLAAAIYKQGEQSRKNGDMQQAIRQFARIRDVAPQSDINIAAAFDVAVSYVDAQKWGEAVTAFRMFREKYPDHELVVDATQHMIKAYMELGSLEKAAGELERLGGMKDDPEFRRKLDLQVAALYEKAGSQDKLVTVWKRYVALYPRPADQAQSVREKLANMYKERGDQANYLHWLREIVLAQGRDGGGERATYVAAKAAYTLALPKFMVYRELHLTAPLQQSMKLKKKMMKTALDAFSQAASYGVPEVTTAATYHIASIYGNLAEEMHESERPADLSTEELEQYDILLAEQAFPFEEKAIEIHENNARLVARGVYDEWVMKSLDALTTLYPVRYAKAEKVEGFVDVIR